MHATVTTQVPHGGCTVRARSFRSLGLGLICLGLFTTLGGCCVPRAGRGFIIHGDWSLELNRIPWMAERGAGYQELAATCDPCQAECPGDCALSKSGNPTIKCLSKPGFAEAAPAAHSAATAASAAGAGRSRFFPVPTRPVFSKRGGSLGAIKETLVPPSFNLEVIPVPPPSDPPPSERSATEASAKTTHLR